jgi:hypothetical protein
MHTVYSFGDELLRTQDLDPVYVALRNARLDAGTGARLCLAYWLFYHLGVAARLAECRNPSSFWHLLEQAAANHDRAWPRGTERRHFRGDLSITGVQELRKRYGARDAMYAVEGLLGIATRSIDTMTFQSVANAAKEHYGFGDWIAFKVADMSERVLGYDTDFADCELGIYKDPRQGAALVATGDKNTPISNLELRHTCEVLVSYWQRQGAKAPPAYDRLVNIQEVETILCKYKSHRNGHYPVGKDTREIAHGLDGWGDLAQQLQKGLPHGTQA